MKLSKVEVRMLEKWLEGFSFRVCPFTLERTTLKKYSDLETTKFRDKYCHAICDTLFPRTGEDDCCPLKCHHRAAYTETYVLRKVRAVIKENTP